MSSENIQESITKNPDNKRMSEDIVSKLDLIHSKIDSIEQKQNQILFLFKINYVISIIYWIIILSVALGLYIYFKDLVLGFFNNNQSIDKLFELIEKIYQLLIISK